MNTILTRIAYYIATTGSGGVKMRGAGTIASVNALFVHSLVRLASDQAVIDATSWVVFLGVCAVGWWATAVTLQESKEKDPSWITIDEWLAVMMLCFALWRDHWSAWVAAVVLFRVFDIYKFGLTRVAEKLPGAWGVMADDLVAAAHVILLFKIVPLYQFLQGLIFS